MLLLDKIFGWKDLEDFYVLVFMEINGNIEVKCFFVFVKSYWNLLRCVIINLICLVEFFDINILVGFFNFFYLMFYFYLVCGF